MKRIYPAVLAAAVAGTLLWQFNSGKLDNTSPARYAPVEKESQKLAKNWHGAETYYKKIRANQLTGEISLDDIRKAEAQVMDLRSSSRSLGITWTEMGPENIGGRTRDILIDKDNSSRIYAGSVGGGLFVSDNAAGTWEPVHSLSATLKVSCLDQDSDGWIYLGTGNSFEGSSSGPGKGLFVSKDRGETWEVLPSTEPLENLDGVEWAQINDVKVDPQDPNRIFAATNFGLRVSTDRGATWVNPLKVNNCSIELKPVGQEIEINEDGRVFVATNTGLFYSDDGTCPFEKDQDIPTNQLGRMTIAIAPSDHSRMYAATVHANSAGVPAGQTGKIKDFMVSDDYGSSWQVLGPPYPVNDYQLFGSNGQGNYDLALAVDPLNKESFLIGGVQMIRFNQQWNRASGEFLSEFSPYYVHSDKHCLIFDENNPNILYIGSDGGVTKSIDGGYTFFAANRGYNVTQFYSLAFDKKGTVIAGTQDNGTLRIDPKLPGRQMDGVEILGGDGFDCEVSNLTGTGIASYVYSNVYRSRDIMAENPSMAEIFGDPTTATSPFHTELALWESDQDLTSQDSILFSNDINEVGVATGTGLKRNFSGTIEPLYSGAQFDLGSLYIEAGGQTINFDQNGVASGDGTGSIQFLNNGTSATYDITFDIAPATNIPVNSFFTVHYPAGVTLVLNSLTEGLPISHQLTNNLNHGESILVQDPVQSLLALNVGVSNSNTVFICRGILRYDQNPEFEQITASLGGNINQGDQITCMEFTKDGNHLFVGLTTGNVYRISGLNQYYGQPLGSSPVTTTLIYDSPMNQAVTGIALQDVNENIAVITLGNFGNDDYVYLTQHAVTAQNTGDAGFMSIQSNLPKIPVYDAEFVADKPNHVLIGTEYGVYSISNILSSNLIWEDENATLGNVAVFDVRQQKLGWDEANNYETIYLGTHGRGIWRTGDLTNINNWKSLSGKDAIDQLTLYPNPGNLQTNLSFESNQSGTGDIVVYDLSGKMVKQLQGLSIQSRENLITLDVSALPAGIYSVQLRAFEHQSTGKLLVVH